MTKKTFYCVAYEYHFKSGTSKLVIFEREAKRKPKNQNKNNGFILAVWDWFPTLHEAEIHLASARRAVRAA